MKNLTKAISVLVVTVLGASIAMAQGGGGQRQGGGGFGQRGGGQNYELNLLNRSDVQKDLGLTNDQITKVEDYIAKSRPQRPGGGGAGGGGNGGGGGGQRQGGGGGFGGGGGQMTAEQIAEFQKQAAERRAKTRKELLEIISEAQLKRVDEINLQINGYMVLSQPAMQETLGFTAEQKAKVADLQAKQREANQGLFQKMRDQEIAQEDFRAAMTKNNDVMKAELGKILTAEQAEKFKAMQGKPFTADDN